MNRLTFNTKGIAIAGVGTLATLVATYMTMRLLDMKLEEDLLFMDEDGQILNEDGNVIEEA